jgi:hypothetical protein
MPDLTVKRTLVKSPPELWHELSELERLAKHLDAFGEIKITKLEPEHTVAWEGEKASGTVSIEPAGWGTKVTVTAQVEGSEPAPPVVEEVEEPEPAQEPAPEPPAKRGFLAWLFRERTAQPAVELEVAVEQEPAIEEAPVTEEAERTEDPRTVLDEVLDSLGAAHHRPFSRG